MKKKDMLFLVGTLVLTNVVIFVCSIGLWFLINAIIHNSIMSDCITATMMSVSIILTSNYVSDRRHKRKWAQFK